MKKFGYILIGLLIFSAFQCVRCVTNYFKAGFRIKEGKVIYYSYSHSSYAKKGKEIKEADLETFEILDEGEGNHLAKDKNQFYCYGKPIEGLDSKTGEYLGDWYFKDKNSAFFRRKKLKDSDPNSFQIIEPPYSKDHKSVYYDEFKLENCSASSFQILAKNYSRDKNNLYFSRYLVAEADPNGFKLLLQKGSSPYYTDGKQVFHQKKVLKNSDPNSWGRLYGRYSKDKNQAYYVAKIVEGADAATFESHSYKKHNGKQYNAQDKNHRYINGKRLP